MPPDAAGIPRAVSHFLIRLRNLNLFSEPCMRENETGRPSSLLPLAMNSPIAVSASFTVIAGVRAICLAPDCGVRFGRGFRRGMDAPIPGTKNKDRLKSCQEEFKYNLYVRVFVCNIV